jgi:hypothetical protein
LKKMVSLGYCGIFGELILYFLAFYEISNVSKFICIMIDSLFVFILFCIIFYISYVMDKILLEKHIIFRLLYCCLEHSILTCVMYFSMKDKLFGKLFIVDEGCIIYIDLNNDLLLKKFESNPQLLQKLGNTLVNEEFILYKSDNGDFCINSQKVIDNKVFIKQS